MFFKCFSFYFILFRIFKNYLIKDVNLIQLLLWKCIIEGIYYQSICAIFTNHLLFYLHINFYFIQYKLTNVIISVILIFSLFSSLSIIKSKTCTPINNSHILSHIKIYTLHLPLFKSFIVSLKLQWILHLYLTVQNLQAISIRQSYTNAKSLTTKIKFLLLPVKANPHIMWFTIETSSCRLNKEKLIMELKLFLIFQRYEEWIVAVDTSGKYK